MPGDRGLSQRLSGAKNPTTFEKSPRDAYLLAAIRRVHAASGGVYGQLKVWDELRDQNVTVARCTVERLMRRSGIQGATKRQGEAHHFARPNPVAADDLVRRNFTADRPDAVWLSDFTYIRTWEGWTISRSSLMSTPAASWAGRWRPTCAQSLVTDALEMAIAARKDRNQDTVAHSTTGANTRHMSTPSA
jgi:putative transposase